MTIEKIVHEAYDLISELKNLKVKLRHQTLEIKRLKFELENAKRNSSVLSINSNYSVKDLYFQPSIFHEFYRDLSFNKPCLNYISFNSQDRFENSIQSLIHPQFKDGFTIRLLQEVDGKKFPPEENCLFSNNLTSLGLSDFTENHQLTFKIIELEKSLKLMNGLLQGSNDAIAALNRDFIIKVINQSFIELFSRLFDIQIKNDMNLKLLLDDFAETGLKIIKACENAFSGKKASVIVENGSIKQNDYYYYEIRISPLYTQKHSNNIVVIHLVNLTEYKVQEHQRHMLQAEIALSCRSRATGEMAAALSHELNQPLTAIVAYSRTCLFLIDKMAEKYSQCKKLLAPLNQIAIQAKHCGEIILNMKNFICDTQFYGEKIDLNAVINDAISILNYEILDFKLKIKINSERNLPPIVINKIHILQVILNLARNAIEALKSAKEMKPELIIETMIVDHHIAIYVRDNGPGIPVELQSKILTTYFTTKPQGTGLGLGISRSLVEEHGGQLTIVNDQTKGACFMFTLPLSE